MPVSPRFYRFIARGKGIYQAVECDCPRQDERRVGKPDGAWLPRIGALHPGAISFWTETGLCRYIDSGLQDWHARVVNAPVEVEVGADPNQILYSDTFQIICMPEHITITDHTSVAALLGKRLNISAQETA